MLRRNLSLVSCSLGLVFSAAVWMSLLASPAAATNCNGSCGPDTGACTGSSSYCSNYAFCNQSSCSGTFKSYRNVTQQGTSNTRGVRTTANQLCYYNHVCGFFTRTNQACTGIPYFKTCGPQVGATCTECASTATAVNYNNCTYVGPCTEE